jgi:hypothetical protein
MYWLTASLPVNLLRAAEEEVPARDREHDYRDDQHRGPAAATSARLGTLGGHVRLGRAWRRGLRELVAAVVTPDGRSLKLPSARWTGFHGGMHYTPLRSRR